MYAITIMSTSDDSVSAYDEIHKIYSEMKPCWVSAAAWVQQILKTASVLTVFLSS